MNVDLKNSTVVSTIISPKAQTNNTGNGGLDLRGYVGQMVLTVQIGTKTVGDADGAITIRAMTSDTNNISNAVNYGSSVINTTNNTVAIGDISVDTRDAKRYLFAGIALTGTNSPSYPIAVTARGQAQVQPVQ